MMKAQCITKLQNGSLKHWTTTTASAQIESATAKLMAWPDIKVLWKTEDRDNLMPRIVVLLQVVPLEQNAACQQCYPCPQAQLPQGAVEATTAHNGAEPTKAHTLYLQQPNLFLCR